MKEVGQSATPLMFHKREEGSNPFCVSGFQHQATASGSRQQASSRVIILMAKRRFVERQETGAREMSHFQVLKDFCREERETEISKSAQTLRERRTLHAYLDKRTGLVKSVAQKRLSEAEADMSEQLGNKEMLILLSMKSVETSNLRGWSFIKRMTVPMKPNLSRTSRKNIATKLRNYGESVAKKQYEPDN